MMHKYLTRDEHPESCFRLHKTVNMDDLFEDGAVLSQDLPVDPYFADKCMSCASYTNVQKVGDYLANNDILMEQYMSLCKEWRATFVLAFAKNMEETKKENLDDAETVVHYATSLMTAWQTSVYGLIGCMACRLPLSHRFSNEHWLCGCRVYDFIAHAVQEYVDSVTPEEEELVLDSTDRDDYFKWIQRWMEIKMSYIFN